MRSKTGGGNGLGTRLYIYIGPLEMASSRPGTGNETTRGVSTIMGVATGWLWLVPAFRVRVCLPEIIGYGLDLRGLRVP